MNADGSHQTQLTSGRFDGSPVWSPDGSRIAFSSRGLDKVGSDDYEVFIINPDGADLFQLTDSRAEDYSPTWRPAP